ncbi:MAG: LytTR family DNA-binding domain-containing protein [Planctomycetota bacterium]|nr:LytTR family DNA-binding domain-containing protein [Planctomycetota bacterium]
MSHARIRVLVADDEPAARAALTSLVTADPNLELVAECADGSEALSRATELAPDLLILDVRMPGVTGLEVVAALPEDRRPLVVFATAHDDHAVDAFELHAVDYLLKPFDDERFRKALERARARWSDEGPEAGRERLEGVLQDRGEDRIVVPREGSMVLVPFDELEWIEAADQYVRLHLLDGREELMRASMGHLEKRLGGGTFMRVHRSAIVRVDRVVELSSATSGTGRIRLRGGAEVPVSRTRLALVRRALR